MNKFFRLMMSAALVGVSAASFASFTYYGSRASFNSAVPGAALEDFEAGLISPGGFASIPSPLDSTSNNGVYAPGDIQAGVRFVGENSPGFTDFFLGNGWGPYATIGLSSVYTGTGIAMEFTNPNIHSVGIDILQNFGTGGTTVSIYGASGLLASVPVTVTNWQGTFFGFSSTDTISKVVVYDGQLNSGYDGVDNVAFSQAVPEPTTIAAIGCGLALLLRRRSR